MIEEIKKSISEREIKFRAWDGTRTNKMMYSEDTNLSAFFSRAWQTEYNKNIMQYTWLKDKNWNPIYEWDIVKRRQKDWGIIEADNNEYICFIDWFMNWWACRKNRDHCWFTFWWEHIEVIWNIFESPELIQ